MLVSVVEKGWLATGAEPPVKALKRLDFPELGRPDETDAFHTQRVLPSADQTARRPTCLAPGHWCSG